MAHSFEMRYVLVMRRRSVLVVALGACTAAWLCGVSGYGLPGREPATPALLLAQAVQPIPLEAVLRMIEQRYPGRALGARLVDRKGRRAYRIKWIGDDGRVHEIMADANDGQILQIR
jgi:hypothetical protein